MKLGKERLLVIAPHPDDEVLGCYGLMEQVKRNNGEVFVMILTLGGYVKINGTKVTKNVWKNEFQKSMDFIGVDGSEIIFYDDKIKHLDDFSQSQLIEVIESKSKVSISKIKPSIVAIPTIFSTHQDHVHAYKAAISALRPQPQKSSFMPNAVLSYESPEYYFWSSYSEFGKFSPNFYLQFSKKTLDDKITALNMYQSQIKPDHRDGERIRSLSKIRGSEIGVEYAESFHIHRLFS